MKKYKEDDFMLENESMLIPCLFLIFLMFIYVIFPNFIPNLNQTITGQSVSVYFEDEQIQQDNTKTEKSFYLIFLATFCLMVYFYGNSQIEKQKYLKLKNKLDKLKT